MEKPNRKKGQKVTIYNYTLSGKQIIEGTGTLVKDLGAGQWLVRFFNDDNLYERNVEIEPGFEPQRQS
jgi:hypothetical protein